MTLPGNPVSSYVSFEVFLRPAIRAAMGHADLTRPVVRRPADRAPSTHPPASASSAAATSTPWPGTVAPWGGPGSHLLSWLAGADCMIVLGEDVTHLEAGERGRGVVARLTDPGYRADQLLVARTTWRFGPTRPKSATSSARMRSSAQAAFGCVASGRSTACPRATPCIGWRAS